MEKRLFSTDKKIIIGKWKASEVQVIVATRVFGMGVIVSNVDMVVRVGCLHWLKTWCRSLGGPGEMDN